MIEVPQITAQICSLIRNGAHEALFRFYIKDDIQGYSAEIGRLGCPLQSRHLKTTIQHILALSLKLVRRGTGNVLIQSDVIAVKKIPRALKVVYPVLASDRRLLYDVDEVYTIQHPTAIQVVTYISCKEMGGR